MKILGIGNALVDILALLPDEKLLEQLEIAKGSMNLISSEQRNAIFALLEGIDLVMTTGGSVSNTIRALQNLECPSGFIGKVGDDHYGKFYLEELMASGVKLHLSYEADFSGTALCLITPDGERTFTTYLGAAARMKKQDLPENIMQGYTHLYVEGYLVQSHELIESAMVIAKEHGLKVILDLASFNVVEAEAEFLSYLVTNYVDILFANEEEAVAYAKTSPGEAIHEIASQVEIAVVKLGSRGSWVKQGELFYHIPCYEVLEPIDTTAAGDHYAAGFLYGLTRHLPLDKCAEIGTLLSYHIIQVVGTRIPDATWTEIKQQIQEIINKQK